MGGSKPVAPQILAPAPTSPIVFQSVVPLKSYRDLSAQLGRFETELGKIQGQRYSEAGTPAEIGAAQQARNVKTEEAYLASLPKGDRYLAQTTGMNTVAGAPDSAGQPFRPSTTALDLAKSLSAKALERIGEVPAPTISETPEWAKGTLQYKKVAGKNDKGEDITTYEEVPGKYSGVVADSSSDNKSPEPKTKSKSKSKSKSKNFLNFYSRSRFPRA